MPNALAERLDEQFRRLAGRKGVPHALAVIESTDGSFRWARAAGDADTAGRPLTVETPFFIASVTKLYIAAAIFRLHEQGRLSLDDSMARHLPAALWRGLHRLDGVDHSGEITIRHLLGHSSGLPDWLEAAPKGEKSLLHRLVEGEDQSWTVEEIMAMVRDSLTPHFPPQPLDGRRRVIRYSDTNYQALIAIIEAVTGQRIHEAFDEMLYRPLGLEHTWHPGTARRGSGPEPAAWWVGDRPADLPLALRAFGDLYSTAHDTVTFMRGLVGGRLFERAGTLERMRSEWATFPFSLNPVRTSPGWPIEYGLGMMRFRTPRFLSPFRPAPSMVGHTGVTGSWLFHCPELDLILSGTVDQATAAAVPFWFVPKLLAAWR
jgi:D-alanyl-D-alanine carboxypeptidase